MRALGPAVLMSLDLWAAMAWCFMALCTLVGIDSVHLSPQGLGVWLLGIALVFGFSVIWLERRSTPPSR